MPQDRLKTIAKIKELLKPSDHILSSLMELSSAELANEAIIGLFIKGITSDVGALEFCDTMEVLVDSKQSEISIEALRNGT